MKVKIRQVAAGAGIALAVGTAGAFGQGVRTVDAGGGLYLHQIGPRVTLREPSGLVSELSLPPGASVRRLKHVTGGWLVAGEVDAAAYSDLFLLRSQNGVQTSLPAPPNEADEPLRGGPLPLVEDGRLVGLAWLAGAGVRQTAVWAARWSGEEWSRAELVSPVGPGTQIAIDGAVLADGSWLLVWSAYDGSDDEIRWSLRRGGRWSESAVLHEANDWPDIRPTIVATGRGALVAWNSFDGELYRVRLAAFVRGDWRDLGPVDAAGAARPSLTPYDNGALLVYRTVRPPAWILLHLDAGGEILRAAEVANETPLQPGIGTPSGSAPVLEWPGERIGEPHRAAVEWRAEP